MIPPDSWLIPLLLAGLIPTAAFVLVLVSSMIQSRRFQDIRQQVEPRLAELARHQRELVSRLDRLENRLVPSSSQEAGDSPSTPSITKETRLSGYRPPTAEGRYSVVGDAAGDGTLITVPDLAAAGHEPPDQTVSELGERYGEILSLAESGTPPDVIARKTGQPIGHVELILGLYRKLHSVRTQITHAPQH